MFQTTSKRNPVQYSSRPQPAAFKWQCKICNLKQSAKRIHFESQVASECRQFVQFNNMRSGELKAKEFIPSDPCLLEVVKENRKISSKWSLFDNEED